jgi:hypothetical protein
MVTAGLLLLISTASATPTPIKPSYLLSEGRRCVMLSGDTTRGRVIRGLTYDKDEKGLEFTTLHLLTRKDSTHVATVLSDIAGRFEFPAVLPGEYLIKATQISYKDTYTPAFQVTQDQGPVQLSPIVLERSTLLLKEVQVTGRKQLIERQVDRFVVNVDAMPAAAGGSVYDVLKNSPGVTVTSTEAISMMGKSGVVVMIDDRPVQMTPEALLNMLKSMPTESIQTLEVITTPPARFEAEGNAGIINIRTKKRQTEGWNTSLSLRGGQGRYTRYSGGGILNVKKGIFDFNGSYFTGRARSFQRINQQATFRQTGQQEAFSNILSDTYQTNTAFSHDVKTQIDIKTGKSSNAGIVATGFILNNPTNSDNTSINLLSRTQGDTTVNTHSRLNDLFYNYSLDAYYKTSLDTLGKELSLDANYAKFASDKDQKFTNEFYINDTQENVNLDLLRCYFSATTLISSLKADLLLPYTKYKVEAGAKYSWVTSSSDFVFQKQVDDFWVNDLNRTNQFKYQESIYATYFSASRKVNKFTFKAGLRTEYTRTKGISLTTNLSNKNNYFKLFPTLYIQYVPSSAYQVNLSYSRRIGRPPYSYLNPFLSYLSEYFSNQGNPFLQPSFTHTIEWSNIFKGNIMASPFFNYTTSFFSEFPKQNFNNQEITYTFDNIGQSSSYGITFVVPITVAKWWKIEDDITVYGQDFISSYPQTVKNTQKLVYNLSLSNAFTVMPRVTAQLSGYYNSPSIQGLYTTVAYYSANAGTNIKLFKNQGNLSISLADIFFTERGQASTRYTNQDFSFKRKNDTRILRFSFTYKLGDTGLTVKKRRENASQDELNRAQ